MAKHKEKVSFSKFFKLLVISLLVFVTFVGVNLIQKYRLNKSQASKEEAEGLFKPRDEKENIFTGDVIVKFKDSVSASKVDDEPFYEKHNAKLSKKLPLDRTVVLKGNGQDPVKLAEKFKESTDVEYAEPDLYLSALYYPNDPAYVPHPNKQWYLDKIWANYAWDISKGTTSGGAPVKVAVIDSGIQTTHQDLIGKVVAKKDLVAEANRNDAVDKCGHGTYVASIVGALTNNGIGISSVGHNVKLIDVRVINSKCEAPLSDVAAGIVWASNNGADILSLSLGIDQNNLNGWGETLEKSVKYAWGAGKVIVAAAGNSGAREIMAPAKYGNVLVVMATDSNDNIAWFSNYDSARGVAAPGKGIYAAWINHPYPNTYETHSGTSASTPMVSGIAALIKAKNPGWSNGQIKAQIENTSDKVSGSGVYFKYGRVNAYRALLRYPIPCPKINYRRCSSSSQVEFSWQADWWAQKYVIRLDKSPYTDWFNKSAGDQWIEIMPPYQGTRWTTTTISPNTYYKWDMQAIEGGTGGARCPLEQFKCQ